MGDEHGPGAVLALEEMMALAKLKNNGGSLSTSYATLARRSFITSAKAKRVVADAAAAGIIEIGESDPKSFTAQFVKWLSWQPKDPTGSARKAAIRAREQEQQSHGDVT
jgi:hypothetical protein